MTKPKRSFLQIVLLLLLICLAITALALIGNVQQISREIQQKFDGKKWKIPAIVYARPLEIYPGMALTPDLLEQELQLAGYRKESPLTVPGAYFRTDRHVEIATRKFHFPDEVEPARRLLINFQGGRITTITASATGEPMDFVRLDPARIGSFHPTIHEDRLLLSPDEIPELLRDGLIAVEDKNFAAHFGISPIGIIRAAVANLMAGKVVQGGSTLTQQLVKNFFLDAERSLSRKAREAVMAVILDMHYSKEEILTAYINEVFLGQDGNRAIHGFGLAAQFYFRRNLEDLSTGQLATLIGMVKGPSVYDPRRYPEKCLERRKVVLRLMLEDGVISEQVYAQANNEPLTDTTAQTNGYNRFPAFLELVKRQLQEEYREEDLQGNGLKILTSLNPQIQFTVEQQLKKTITQLEQKKEHKQLQGAVVVTNRETGEVEGIAGGINPLGTGFNRALDALRPIGSLVKPAVYLAGLAKGYTLASPLLDAAIQVETKNSTWSPQNYDKQEHGRVAFYQALARSLNLATVRLGMDIGLKEVIKVLQKLGASTPLKEFPSLLLGAVEMSPFQVSQMYQTIASGGFYVPLRSIRSVMTSDNTVLSRYGLEVEQRFSPQLVYLLNHGLERVISEGTASRYPFPSPSGLAGKTGTSNEFRDSWFAGYAQKHLAVVWLGRDDNTPTSLTGASGALKVWGGIMSVLSSDAEQAPAPSGIVWNTIDQETLTPVARWNSRGTSLPFLAGTEPQKEKTGMGIDFQTIEKETQSLFEKIKGIFK